MHMKQMSPERFRQVRQMLGLSQDKMAKLIGYENRASVSLFESGHRPITPRISLLVELLADKHERTEP